MRVLKSILMSIGSIAFYIDMFDKGYRGKALITAILFALLIEYLFGKTN